MTQPKDASERLSALMRSLADDAEAASDDAVLQDAASAGIDLKSEQNRVRDLLLGAVLRAKKSRLESARAAHVLASKVLQSRPARLPQGASEQRELLNRFLARAPHMRSEVVTLQHREFESFSDADVESVLRQLDALGLLDDDLERKS